MKTIGIIFAMEEELDALKEYLKIDNINKIYDLTFYETNYHNKKIILCESGIGKVNAGRTTQIMIDYYKVNFIYNIGVAGGIDNSLSVGDIVISNEVVQHDFDITAFNHKKGYISNIGDSIKIDKELLENTKNILNENNILYKEGIIATGDIFCTEKKMGEKIHNKFNALCVEMEGAAIGQVAYLCKVPFIILRSISDTCNNNNKITYEEFLPTSCKKIAYAMNSIIKRS